MRLVLLLIALLGGFVLVGMLIAPYQPNLRSWYIQNACGYLDQLSVDICAAARREAGEKGASNSAHDRDDPAAPIGGRVEVHGERH